MRPPRLRRLEPVLRRALRGPCRLPRGATLLVAVSGGADSTALLAGLASVGREFGLRLAAAHLHHGLRGADADADLAHVRALCARLGVPLAAARWDCRARMARRGLAGEAGLRVLRRAFLRAAARAAGAGAIATAHTADDQLETVLLRLARGTGLPGLGAMRPRHGPWLKPLLAATRHDVERDLARAGIAWREDASNAGRAFARNRVRHEVVPALLAALGAPAGPAAARRAGPARRVAAAAAEAREAGRMAARAAAAAAPAAAGAGLDAVRLAALPAAVRRAAVRRAWERARPRGPRLQRTHLAALLGVVRAGRPARVALPDGWQGVLAGGLLDFVPAGGRAPAGGDARLRGSRGRASARGDAANRARRVRTGRPRATPLPRAARQERP